MMLKIGGVLALLVALFFGEQYVEGLGAAKAAQACKIDMQALQLQADEAAHKLQAAADHQNITDHQHEKSTEILTDHIHTLAGLYAGRLRDPNATTMSAGATACAADPGAGNTAETVGLLSVQLTDLLATTLRDADRINDAYISCHARIVKIADQ